MDGFDFINYQKQFLDTALKASKQLLNSTENNDEKNLFENLYKQQMAWFKQFSDGGDWGNLTMPSTDNLTKWFEMQADFMKKYSDFTLKPQSSNFMNPFMEKSFLPFNVESVFQNMQKSWESIQKSIKFNMFEPDAMSHLFGENNLQDTVSKMLGFNNLKNFKAPIKEAESYFNSLTEFFKQDSGDFNNLLKNISKEGMPAFGNGFGVGIFENIMEMINKSVSQAFNPLQKLFPVKERDEMVNAVQNIQYSHLSFLYKSNAMQLMLVEGGKNAMPETIKYFSEHHSKEGHLPDYETFFHKFVEILEHKLIETLNSPEYSKVQSGVANALVTTKKQVEEFKVLLFDGLPFVKYAEFDDLLLEISTLKRKNRQLESRLKAIEEQLLNGKKSEKKSK